MVIDSGSFNKAGKGLIFSTSVCLIPLSQRDAMSDSLKYDIFEYIEVL